MSKVCQLLHIVINTKYRSRTIELANKAELYKYITGIVKNRNSKVLQINGTDNHLHILLDLHPTVPLASLMQEVKQSTSRWMKVCGLFPRFECWGKEYFAFSVSPTAAEAVKRYIRNQERHHNIGSFENEIKTSVANSGLEWNDHLLT